MIPWLATVALAQQITSLDKLPEGTDPFDSGQIHNSLPCTVDIAKPELNFGFRFQSNYTVRIPLDAYVGATHRWRIVFRVTPAGGQPVYFSDLIDLPASSQPGFVAVSTGTFFTGAGHYDVKWSLRDDLGRVCRQDWTLDAHPDEPERRLTSIMPRGTVGDFSWHPESPIAKITRHVTVLLNAAIPISGRMPSAGGQWATVLTILSSILEGLPEADVRLIVFNLDQQRELFVKDHFTTADFAAIVHIADTPSQWIVNSNSLQSPRGGWNLIRDLENNERHAVPSPDTIIFLGLPTASAEKMPPGLRRPSPGQSPRLFYLPYRITAPTARENLTRLTAGAPLPGERGGCDPGSPCGSQSQLPATGGGGGRGRMASPVTDRGLEGPDPIKQFVQRAKGKTLVISSVDALSKAISEIKNVPKRAP